MHFCDMYTNLNGSRNSIIVQSQDKKSVQVTYFVKEGLVEGCVLSLQFMYFFIELGLNVGTFHL